MDLEFDGFLMDSKEEMYFAWWCDELKRNGYISSWKKYDRDEDMEVVPKYDRKWVKETVLKTKIKVEEKNQTILQDKRYTPDFKIYWNEGAENLFYTNISDQSDNKWTSPLLTSKIETYYNPPLWSLVEVKPEFDQNNMTREFRVLQKVLWHFKNLYVNLAIPSRLFKETFTPQRYLWTDGLRQKRKIKWKVKTLDEFIKSKKRR